MHGAFVGFVRDRVPGWPPYDEAASVMVFDTDATVVAGGYDSARALTEESWADTWQRADIR